MIKSVQVKNIVIFSLSIFTFFSFSAFGMNNQPKKQDKKSPTVKLQKLYRDREKRNYFAKSVDVSPTVNKINFPLSLKKLNISFCKKLGFNKVITPLLEKLKVID